MSPGRSAAPVPGSRARCVPGGCFSSWGPRVWGRPSLARSLAEFLLGTEQALLRFDMSEYMERHSVSRFIGSPPGYVGHGEGGHLTERVRRNPYCVLLLDEIEKAHPDVWNLLLQVFEDGRLTDGLGNTVDFRNAMIIMTSNLGARYLLKQATVGFASADPGQRRRDMRELIHAEVRKTFRPEFLNRLDSVVVFDTLTDDDLLEILRRMGAADEPGTGPPRFSGGAVPRGRGVPGETHAAGAGLRRPTTPSGAPAACRRSARRGGAHRAGAVRRPGEHRNARAGNSSFSRARPRSRLPLWRRHSSDVPNSRRPLADRPHVGLRHGQPGRRAPGRRDRRRSSPSRETTSSRRTPGLPT